MALWKLVQPIEGTGHVARMNEWMNQKSLKKKFIYEYDTWPIDHPKLWWTDGVGVVSRILLRVENSLKAAWSIKLVEAARGGQDSVMTMEKEYEPITKTLSQFKKNFHALFTNGIDEFLWGITT